MLRLDLARLEREGSLEVVARIPSDDPLWGDLGVASKDGAQVDLRASLAGTGEVVVRGRIEAVLAQECRRCLEPVTGEVGADVTLVFVPSDVPGAEDDGEVHVYDVNASELDLSVPVREELVFAIDLFVVCDPECKGLCPRCGTNLNTDSCDCVMDEPDPRWDALRALKKE